MSSPQRTALARAVAISKPALIVAFSAPLLIAAAYVIKSALGIDLMEGPSPLHAWLYWR